MCAGLTLCVLDVQAVHAIHWFSHSRTGVHHIVGSRVLVLYYACAHTLIRVCLYIALCVAVHRFVYVQKTARKKILTY